MDNNYQTPKNKIDNVMRIDRHSIFEIEFGSITQYIGEFTVITNFPLYICVNTAKKHTYMFYRCCFNRFPYSCKSRITIKVESSIISVISTKWEHTHDIYLNRE